MKHINDYKIINYDILSDHNLILLKVRFNLSKEKKTPRSINWNFFLDKDNKADFNKDLNNKLQHFIFDKHAKIYYSEFSKRTIDLAKGNRLERRKILHQIGTTILLI